MDNTDDSISTGGSGGLAVPLLVALIPLVVVLFMMSARTTTVQQTPAQVIPVASTYQTASAVPVAPANQSLTAGMRPMDVQQALGRPDNVKVVPIGGVTTQQWYYSHDGHTLEVDFNTNNVVENWTNY